MFIFDAWMKRIMDRFDKPDKTLDKMNEKKAILDGELLLDNTDLCQLLHVSTDAATLLQHRRTTVPDCSPKDIL